MRLAGDQAGAVRAVASSGRRLDVLVGPAGTGKTTTLAGLKTVWEAAHGRGSVIGLAPSSTAAAELAEALGVACENTAKWLYESTGPGAVQRAAYLARLAAERLALGDGLVVRLDFGHGWSSIWKGIAAARWPRHYRVVTLSGRDAHARHRAGPRSGR